MENVCPERRHLLGCEGVVHWPIVLVSFSALMGAGRDIYNNNIWTGKVRCQLICVFGAVLVLRCIGAKLLGSKGFGEG